MRHADRPVRRQTELWRTVLALSAVLVTVAACGQSGMEPTRPDDAHPTRAFTPIFSGAEALPAPDLTDDGPGSLVEMKPVKGDRNFDEAGATAARIVYRSTNGDGRPSQVSALLAVPAGPPPAGGWPIISFGHEATGLLPKCAPTLAAEFWGYSSGMAVYLRRGFAIVMSDYHGLGVAPGPNEQQHSILDAPTLGNNIIDAARAMHRAAPSTSTNWGALGAGEGGLAAWAAAERGGAYGAGMNMVGAVAVNPIADLAPLADADRTAALTTADQYRLQDPDAAKSGEHAIRLRPRRAPVGEAQGSMGPAGRLRTAGRRCRSSGVESVERSRFSGQGRCCGSGSAAPAQCCRLAR